MRFALLLIGFAVACPARQARTPAAPPATRPDHLFGITLRQRLNPGAVSAQRCSTGREFALEDGVFDIVADDILFSAPEEHQDTSAVLAALAQFTACAVLTREGNAAAIVTIADSLVGNALITWPEGGAPSYDEMVTTLTQMYGEPFQNQFGVRYWAQDSMEIHLGRRGPFGAGTTLTLSDARACEKYEVLVHRNNNIDHRSSPCWEDPPSR